MVETREVSLLCRVKGAFIYSTQHEFHPKIVLGDVKSYFRHMLGVKKCAILYRAQEGITWF